MYKQLATKGIREHRSSVIKKLKKLKLEIAIAIVIYRYS